MILNVSCGVKGGSAVLSKEVRWIRLMIFLFLLSVGLKLVFE